MKISSRFWIVIALEVIALEIGAYTYATLYYQERQDLLLLTGILCLFAAITGTLVTRAQAQAISTAILVLGIIAFSIGLYFLVDLGYHERAFTALGIGILGLLGGLIGILKPRSTTAVFGGLLALGIVALGLGLYNLTIMGYHGRAYIVLGTGTLCLLGGLGGIIMHQFRPTLLSDSIQESDIARIPMPSMSGSKTTSARKRFT